MYRPFVGQYFDMLAYLHNVNDFSIGTLGPTGTSSSQALQYFTDNMVNLKWKVNYECKLYDTFDEVLDAVLSRQINFALVPSAYRDITKYFWHPKLRNVFTFIYPTPKYGIVSKINFAPESNKYIRIATCEPVECLIYTFLNKMDKKVIKVITPSTTKALETLLYGEADLAVTNETSFAKYNATYEIKFITKLFNVQMLWCLFSNSKS